MSDVTTASKARTSADRLVRNALVGGVVLIALAKLVPVATRWNVRADSFAPLSAEWHPRVGVGTPFAVLVGVLVVTRGIAAAARLRWRSLLGASYLVGLAWSFSLAFVDGGSGISAVFENKNEYLRTAHHVGDISTLLHTFVQRIPEGVPGSWTTHVSGHPPGALLFFVGLVHLGLGSGLASGIAVTVLAATSIPAVLLTVDRIGGRNAARRVAPFVAVGPFAIWSAVSADALFAAVVAWAVYAMSRAATSRVLGATHGWGLAAGLLFGCALLLSYGLAIAGLLLVAVLVVTRTWRPVPSAVAGTVLVVGAFAAAGFRWWSALGPLHGRYWAGIAHIRPTAYWIWADFAALLLSAGLAAAPAAAVAVARWRSVLRPQPSPSRTLVVFVLAALACVAVADLSLMSKAEVERIWLPFVPWLLLGVALLSVRWRRRLLATQIAVGFVLQTLLFTLW